MSAPSSCCNPCDPDTVTEVPGVQGEAGEDGTDGVNAYTTTTTSTFNVPVVGNNTASLAFVSTLWMTVGQNVFIAGAGNFEVISKADSTHAVLKYLDYTGNTNSGNPIVAGAAVSPSGTQQALAAALPTAFTDNSTGVQSDTIAAGVGVSTLSLSVELVQITGAADVMTEFVPGYAFKIISIAARVSKVVTTAAKAVTLNLEIDTTNVTGGLVALTSANCTPLGAAIAGSAITAANTGSATSKISLEAASVTAFSEGAVEVLIVIQNTDTASAFASLAKHVDDLITALS